MVDATPPSTARLPDDTYSPSLKNPAVALCNEAWVKIHGATRSEPKTSTPPSAAPP